MNNLPYVSIIVAVFNGEKVIDDCVQSLLAQDYPKDKYEIIVVDNNSKDRTKEVIKKYPVRCVSEDKIQGPSAARNAGADVAKGEFLAFFDADQVAEENWLKKILEGWEDNKYGAFAGRNVHTNSKKNILGEYWEGVKSKNIEEKQQDFAKVNYFAGGNIALKQDVFMEIGGFDVSMITCEDIDMGLRLQKETRFLIKYNNDAIAYHKERQDMASLLKREFGFGYGSALLERKHREIKKMFLILLMKTILRTALGFAVLILGIFKPMKRRKEHLSLTLLDMAMKWANFLGRSKFFYRSLRMQ